MSTILNHEPKKVLFLALSGIGNVLMQLPTIRLFKKRFPNAHLTVWVAPRGTRELVEAEDSIDAVIEAPIRRSLLLQGLHIQRLRRKDFDTGIMLSPGQLWKGSLYMLLGGMDVRVGHQYPHLSSSFLLTHSIPEKEDLHDIEQNLALLQPFGVEVPEVGSTNYELIVPEANQREAKSLITALKVPDNRPVIGFHPGSASGYEWKRWPLENFAELGKQLIAQHNAFILIFGGREEATLKKRLRTMIGKKDCAIQINSLLTTAALIKHCKVLVSNDSGLMHLGAATGTPTLGLFGPTDERLTGPRGERSWSLRASGTEASYVTESGIEEMKESHETLRALSVQQVFDKLSEIWP